MISFYIRGVEVSIINIENCQLMEQVGTGEIPQEILFSGQTRSCYSGGEIIMLTFLTSYFLISQNFSLFSLRKTRAVFFKL